MRYKREETFRYEFGRPIVGVFKIMNVNGENLISSPGNTKIHDISPGGLRISTELDLPIDKNKITVEVEFDLISSNKVSGEIVWKKKSYNGEFFYGIELLITRDDKDHLINELKSFVQKERLGN